MRRGMVCIYHFISCKKLRVLPCSYVEDYTNQECTAFFEIDSSSDLTYRFLLEYYFWDVVLSFSKCTVNRWVLNKSIYEKGPISSCKNTYFPSYMACSGSVLNTIGLYNRNSTRKALANRITQRKPNMHGLYAYLMYDKYSLLNFYKSLKHGIFWFGATRSPSTKSKDLLSRNQLSSNQFFTRSTPTKINACA